MDDTRRNLENAIARKGSSLRDISLKIDRNAAYLQQFLTRASPQVLPIDVAVAVAQHLDMDPNELLTPDQQKALARSVALGSPAARSDDDLVRTSPTRRLRVVHGEASRATINNLGDVVREVDAWSVRGDLSKAPTAAEWRLPEGFVRYELRTSPDRLRALVVEVAEPETTLRAGDRVIVDISRTNTPGVFALWEDDAMVFRRLDNIPEGAKTLGRVVWLSRTI